LRRLRYFSEAAVPALVWLLVFGSSMSMGRAASAVTCSTVQHNVKGYDASSAGYGNRGALFVNNIDFTTLHGNIFRSLFVMSNTGPADVEVGWLSTGSSPVSYFEYVTSSGSDSGARHGPAVTANSFPNLKVTAPSPANPNGNYLWKAYLGSSSFDQVTLGFNRGLLVTNSERKNNCDTMWAEFKSLDNCSAVPGGTCSWHGSYFNLACRSTNSGGEYQFNEVDETHHYVKQSGGVTC